MNTYDECNDCGTKMAVLAVQTARIIMRCEACGLINEQDRECDGGYTDHRSAWSQDGEET